MAIVENITIIKGTDRQFDLRIKKSNEDSYPLTAPSLDLSLKMPTDTGTPLNVTLIPNLNGSALAVADAPSGRITVTLADTDTALLKRGDALDMELTIKEGAGPDFDIKKVQYPGQLTVKKALFE